MVAATHWLNYKECVLLTCSGLHILDTAIEQTATHMESFRSLALLSMDTLINSVN